MINMDYMKLKQFLKDFQLLFNRLGWSVKFIFHKLPMLNMKILGCKLQSIILCCCKCKAHQYFKVKKLLIKKTNTYSD